MKRRIAREKALQALYQIDISGTEPAEAIEFVLEDQKADLFLQNLVEGTLKNLQEIDQEISKHLENWSIDRLSKVDVNILRLAIYEIKFSIDVPENVAINEAIEVAKKFGDDKSGKFINGILSKVKGE
ncbi:transcription antitermination factor NusB [Lederbergia wuyishanensis]|uniref:Transcription antitermination protein NusB n=1 Tax=Lederbergia wuyishanensis TaxID=1347903 RepID=A0ABU0D192_9BACI|nr:transcription antitermination factor NusB [Lederbergia wuyishanensis]MCJ8006789.1 transcription antitermination factor NusB [Lederbergia wuyishanensis]MDQ0342171.1 N utilization substance protein B [Lederbergia wuyishanensis]